MQESNSILNITIPDSALVKKYNQSHHFKTSKVLSRNLTSQPTHFLELAIFKQQLKNNFPKALTYRQYHRKVRYYRSIFFILALIFLSMSGIIFYQNIAFTSLLHGDLRLLVKNILCLLTGSLAFFAALLGYSLCIAKEATESLSRKARRKLTQLHAKKRIEYGVQNYFLWANYDDRGLALKAAFHEMQDKIYERQAETTDLLREISNAKGFDTSNHELLFSQALTEMDEHLKRYLQNFKDRE